MKALMNPPVLTDETTVNFFQLISDCEVTPLFFLFLLFGAADAVDAIDAIDATGTYKNKIKKVFFINIFIFTIPCRTVALPHKKKH